MSKKIVLTAVASAVMLAGCAGQYGPMSDLDRMTQSIVKAGFQEKGIAKL
ncbi:MAG: hypothetical protein RLY67_558, partial [Pseudomonadota bacterium]